MCARWLLPPKAPLARFTGWSTTPDHSRQAAGDDEWRTIGRRSSSTNLTGAFNFARAAIFNMMKAKGGSILNITSVSGLVGMAGQVELFGVQGWDRWGLTKALAKEVGSRRDSRQRARVGVYRDRHDRDAA